MTRAQFRRHDRLIDWAVAQRHNLYVAQMAKAFLNVDPFSCVLCGA
jgi:hypothetical protein